MNIRQILSPESTFCCSKLSSKKKVLEKVSEIMADLIQCSAQDIFVSLFTREKLGTTALGHGVAIPHGRAASCKEVTAVFILLDNAIDYDAPDGELVDIVFAILVPEKATPDQLKYLAKIAKVLSQQSITSQIRHAHCADALYDIINSAMEKSINLD